MVPQEVNAENEELIRFQQDTLRCKGQPDPCDTSKIKTEKSIKGAKKNATLIKKKKSEAKKKATKPRFKIGQLVRISRLKDKFTCAYDHHWMGELFNIAAVYKRNGHQDILSYPA